MICNIVYVLGFFAGRWDMITSKMCHRFVLIILTFIAIRGENCTWFKSIENIEIDPATCRMETSATPFGINSCLDECDKNSQVRYISVSHAIVRKHHMGAIIEDQSIFKGRLHCKYISISKQQWVELMTISDQK